MLEMSLLRDMYAPHNLETYRRDKALVSHNANELYYLSAPIKADNFPNRNGHDSHSNAEFNKANE